MLKIRFCTKDVVESCDSHEPRRSRNKMHEMTVNDEDN